MVSSQLNSDSVTERLRNDLGKSVALYERRPGVFQVILPIFHEDGDMLDVYLESSPRGGEMIRLCDFGMTLMRLSFSYEINTPARERIFDGLLAHNGVQSADGGLYLDSSIDMLCRSVLQFAGCIQKICNMRYWSREVVRSEFMNHLDAYVTAHLGRYEPQKNVTPLPDNYDILTVDWQLSRGARIFYLFGVGNDSKAKTTAITLLEFQKEKLPFLSMVVHENMEELSRNTRTYLTNNADKQFPTLAHFREGAADTIDRMAA